MKMSFNPALKFAGITVTAAILLLSSCKKESNNSADDAAISEDEAVEVMTQGVSTESGGMAAQTEAAASVTARTSLTCGQSSDTVITAHSLTGAVISYSYNAEITRTLTCENNVPSMYAFSYVGANTYDAPRMSSSDNTTASFTINGLQSDVPDLTFNQNYVRNGTQQSKIRLQRSFASTLTITSTAVIVNKATRKITSGTATIQFTGEVVGGGSVSYGGTLTFLGNSQGTIVLNNGHTFNIHW